MNASSIALSERIKKARLIQGFTQATLAEKVGVVQAAVNHWETGTSKPKAANLKRLEEVLGGLRADKRESKEQKTQPAFDTDLSTYGVWLAQQRQEKKFSVPELAKAAGVSPLTIYNIEGGKAQNPQVSTRQKLEGALGIKAPSEIVEDTSRTQRIEGLGELIDFDPFDKPGWPSCKGVYVLYDISQRPIYVGKAGTTIAARLGTHYEKFWFREPIVNWGAYIEVEDKTLRHRLEQVLIRFLKSNAVINKQSAESFDPE